MPPPIESPSAIEIPAWCEVHRGESHILLVAPHGGRRPPIDATAPPANLRVNDVYTPEVTRELGARLDAGWIVNGALDRNDLDLNRLSQVRRRAPWFLEVLLREIQAILTRHGRAELLFVHGWNNGQLKCDIGLGGREHEGAVLSPPGAALSVSPDYLETRVRAFRAACAERGIAAPLGEKYPASHANNLVQLFASRERGPDADVKRFDDLVRRGCVQALQLELTLPLRCPGTWRDRFVDAVVVSFGAGAGGAHADPPRPARSAQAKLPAGGESLQFYDAAAGIGLFAGVGRMGPASTGGRLLLFLGGQRVALFTGEEVGHGDVPPLHFVRRGDRVELRFDGPILLLDDAAEYLDLEAALAASTSVDVDLSLEFHERGGAPGAAMLGDVRGSIAIEGRRLALAAQGFGHVAALRAAGHAQTMLAASFGAGRAVVGRIADDAAASSTVCFDGGDARRLEDVRLRVIADGDAYTPAAFELHSPSCAPLYAETLSRMAILRSAGEAYLRVAFGVARFAWDGEEGHGLYEHALPLAAKS